MRGGLELFSQEMSDLCPRLFLKASAIFNEAKILRLTHYAFLSSYGAQIAPGCSS